MAYGITSTGFVKKTLAIIVSELEATYKAKFGNSLNVQSPSLASILIGIAADREAAVWDLAEEDYNSKAPSTAQGVALDNCRELTNEERLGALASQAFKQYFFGAAGTVVPTTFIASVLGNASAKFSPASAVTLGAGGNEVQKLTFSAVPDAGTWTITMPDGQITAALAFNAAASAVQAAIQALTVLRNWSGVTVTGDYTAGFTLTFGGSVGLMPWALVAATSSVTHTSTAVTITPSETTLGIPQAQATMVCNQTGVITADAFSLTTIETPITGLTSTLNADDATVGRAVETDSEFRTRSADEVQSTSATTVEAIRLGLKKVLNVLEAIVYENTGLTTDGNGVPGKALHIYVDGGLDQDVANSIWLLTGGGIQTYGSVTKTVIDSQGLSQSVSFDRPVDKPVYGIVTLTTDPATFPVNGHTLVLDAILAYGNALQIGQSVLLRPKLLPAIVDAVPGITDIAITIGFAPSPAGTSNLTVGINERATFTSSNWTITP